MTVEPQREYSLDDYHRIEETSLIRHEFYRGEIFAMAGGSVAHNHICANVLSQLRVALLDSPCSAFGSDMRLRTPAGLLTYPDVMVICGEILLVPGREDEVTNPALLVEVVSDATRRYDRGEKFDFYKSVPCLRDYFVIEQKEPHIEHHRRVGARRWSTRSHSSLSDEIEPAAVPVRMSLRDVYRRVFETE